MIQQQHEQKNNNVMLVKQNIQANEKRVHQKLMLKVLFLKKYFQVKSFSLKIIKIPIHRNQQKLLVCLSLIDFYSYGIFSVVDDEPINNDGSSLAPGNEPTSTALPRGNTYIALSL